MAIGVVGRKCGMTRVFTDDGASVPVTVVEVSPNRVTQVKTLEKDGYRAVQITTGTRRASRVTAPLAGHYKKAVVEPGRGLWEFRLTESQGQELVTGNELKADQFSVGQMVDVAGISIGKGFAGTIKRHNFKGGRASHGNSLSHRAPGSIGQRQTPGRVFPGMKMSGHMGAERVTVQNLEVVRVDAERNLLLIRGGVPGAPGANLIIRPAVKAKPPKSAK